MAVPLHQGPIGDNKSLNEEKKKQVEDKGSAEQSLGQLEPLAEGFVRAYFDKSQDKILDNIRSLCAKDGLNDPEKYIYAEDTVQINKALEILTRELQNSSNQHLLAHYALMLTRLKKFKDAENIIAKLEALGNTIDVLILKTLCIAKRHEIKTLERCEKNTDALLQIKGNPLLKEGLGDIAMELWESYGLIESSSQVEYAPFEI